MSKYPTKSSDADRRIRQADRLSRVLRVLQLLQSRGRWDAKAIASELEISERTVYRDLAVLELAGVPWTFDREAECYRLRPDYRFPVLGLSDEEVLGQATATAVTQAPGLNIDLGSKPTTQKLAAFAYATDSQWQTITRYQDLAGTKLVAASTFTYDQAGRLQGLTHAQNASILAGFTWTYDTVNRVTAFSSTLYPAESATYTYDAASQLTSADRSGTANDETYSYDANGNRANYSTGVDNRLQSDGTYTYHYDNEGNRTRRTKIVGGSYTEYVWDYRNRLTSVTDKTAAGAITRQTLYTYDVFDRRVAKQVDWDGSGAQAPQKEYYIYDGQHIALSFLDADGPGAQTPTLRHRYLHGAAVD